MGHPKTPRTDALFGVFLQDIRDIRGKHPRSFGKIYYRFDYAARDNDGYNLFIEPDSFPKAVKREITQAFDLRLNRDFRPMRGRNRRNRKCD